MQWKINFFDHLQQKSKLTSSLLDLIESHRNGEAINHGLVKKVVDSFGSYLLLSFYPL
jgi:cullin 1